MIVKAPASTLVDSYAFQSDRIATTVRVVTAMGSLQRGPPLSAAAASSTANAGYSVNR